jgi:hypothetical protein
MSKFSITTLEVAGFASAVQALRLPFGKECRSKTRNRIITDDLGIFGFSVEYATEVEFDEKDLHLMSVLVKRGTEHAKVTRGLIVYAEIEAPVYWWCEAETYRAGHERLSSESTMHVDCKGLSGEELVKAKSEIPMGKMLKKIDFFSYQCLRNIVKQRKGHRLPEWGTFIDWVRTLPFAEQLIFVGLEDE